MTPKAHGGEPPTQRRVGVFGGTFDPPHVGHLALVRHAFDALGLDTVLVLVAGSPPHRPTPAAPAPDRLELVRVAFSDDSRVLVDDRELDRQPSYTVASLGEIADEMPDADLVLLVGADQAETLRTWMRWDDIARLATIGVAGRDPVRSEQLRAIVEDLRADGARVETVDMERIDASSHTIRDSIASGRIDQVTHLLPASIVGDVQRVYGRLLAGAAGGVG